MKIYQEATLTISTTKLTPAEISDYLGMEPDSSARLGEFREQPSAVPCAHQWSIVTDPQQRADDQIMALLEKVQPVRAKLIELASDPDTEIGLLIARYLNDARGSTGGLGINIPANVIEFLAELNAEVDIDEFPRATFKVGNKHKRERPAAAPIRVKGAAKAASKRRT